MRCFLNRSKEGRMERGYRLHGWRWLASLTGFALAGLELWTG